MSEYRQALPTPKTRRASFGLVSLTLLGGLLAMVGLRLVNAPTSFPDTELLDQKLESLRSLDPPATTVFVGSSRIFRSIEPRAIDRAAAARGKVTRSYNLGLPNLTMTETLTVMEALAKLPEPPSTVLLEPTLKLLPNPENLQTLRVVRHMNVTTARTIGSVLLADRQMSWAGKLRSAARASLPALDHYVGRGKLATVWLNQVPTVTRRLEEGYCALESEPGQHIAQRRARFLRQIDRWTSRRSRFDLDSTVRDLTEAEEVLWQRIASQVDAMGAELVFLYPPLKLNTSSQIVLMRGLGRRFPEVSALAYFEGQGPEWLYEPDLWFDSGHVAREVTGPFAELLIDDWLDLGRDTTAE